jgi:hypothetical protein
MKITSKANQSIASQLETIIRNALPLTANTGLSKDVGTIKTDAKSKGKAVLFTYHKSTFRLTENLKVSEKDFTGTFVTNNESKEIENIITISLTPPKMPVSKSENITEMILENN